MLGPEIQPVNGFILAHFAYWCTSEMSPLTVSFLNAWGWNSTRQRFHFGAYCLLVHQRNKPFKVSLLNAWGWNSTCQRFHFWHQRNGPLTVSFPYAWCWNSIRRRFKFQPLSRLHFFLCTLKHIRKFDLTVWLPVKGKSCKQKELKKNQLQHLKIVDFAFLTSKKDVKKKKTLFVFVLKCATATAPPPPAKNKIAAG